MKTQVFLLWLMEKSTKGPNLKKLTVPYKIAKNNPCGCLVLAPRWVNMGWNSGSGPRVLEYTEYVVERREDGLFHVECGKKVG